MARILSHFFPSLSPLTRIATLHASNSALKSVLRYRWHPFSLFRCKSPEMCCTKAMSESGTNVVESEPCPWPISDLHATFPTISSLMQIRNLYICTCPSIPKIRDRSEFAGSSSAPRPNHVVFELNYERISCLSYFKHTLCQIKRAKVEQELGERGTCLFPLKFVTHGRNSLKLVPVFTVSQVSDRQKPQI